MPSRNLEKIYLEDSFYHVYNRGVNKRRIFLQDRDYAVFLSLLKRYLDKTPVKDNKGREYEWLHKRIELSAFCLMPNHFHLLLYQKDSRAMTRLLSGLCTSYTGFFNKKFSRSGPLFQDRFKASLITRDAYLQHISRYLHLNPPNYRQYEWSSLPYYLETRSAGWLNPQRILDLFEGDDYQSFVANYEDHKRVIDEVKSQLADT